MVADDKLCTHWLSQQAPGGAVIQLDGANDSSSEDDDYEKDDDDDDDDDNDENNENEDSQGEEEVITLYIDSMVFY